MKFIFEKRNGCRAVVDGREVVIFSSNDYLGLTSHPDVLKAALEAADTFGAGTGGAPGTTGTTRLHEKLRQAIAAFKSRQNAVIFPSGYHANQALHQALASKDVVFLLDRRHHPSAMDGARLARDSQIDRFDHHDLKGLGSILHKYRKKTCVVSLPSVFTVDGDLAPLDRLAEMKDKFGFALVLDEAHATGCLGQTGRGLEEHFKLHGTADFIMGTFSKALGSQGGFLAYNDDAQKYLTGQFRPFEYSTSLSAVSAAVALRALEMIISDQSIMQSLRRAKDYIIDQCKQNGVTLIYSESMIMLLPCTDFHGLQKQLFDDGFLTIPVTATISGYSQNCLRITPMATHRDDDIRAFTQSLKNHLNK